MREKYYHAGQVMNALADSLNPYIYRMPNGTPAPRGIPVAPDYDEARETLEACAAALGGKIIWEE